MGLNITEARCPILALSHGNNILLFRQQVTSSPTPTQKSKGQKQELSRKSESKTSKTGGGKVWKKPDVQAKVGERATSS